jgi:co-chaperonin GroES (HSP10)
MSRLNSTYQATRKMDQNAWITSPDIPDPPNLPIPLGWHVLIRPYPVDYTSKSKLILPESDVDHMNFVTNVGRVVAVGPCAWNRKEHFNKEGEQFDWVKVGDFVSYPKNTGARRKFKDVSFVLLNDDEVNERLPDPQVFEDPEHGYHLVIPEADLKKYNTIYKETK